MLRNTAFSSLGGEWRRPDPARQLDRFAEAGNCSDDSAPVDRPQLGRNQVLLPVYSGAERSNPSPSSGESTNFRCRDPHKKIGLLLVVALKTDPVANRRSLPVL